MLYAFNTLTKVGQVVYSESLGDYIYKYTNADRYTPECTLGWSTFKLSNAEGIITNNEGMGADETFVDTSAVRTGNIDPIYDGNYGVSVEADTGLDLMYHAVRAWYVLDDNGTTATRDDANVGVYVYDLATTSTLECPTGKEVSDLNKEVIGNKNSVEKNIGDTDKLYEYVIVDNTALGAGYAKVSFEYYITKLGVRSTAADTTVIAGSGAVKNDYIKTDITDIHNGDDIMVLKAGEKAYYVYAFGATSGTVTSLGYKDAPAVLKTTQQPPKKFAKNAALYNIM